MAAPVATCCPTIQNLSVGGTGVVAVAQDIAGTRAVALPVCFPARALLPLAPFSAKTFHLSLPSPWTDFLVQTPDRYLVELPILE